MIAAKSNNMKLDGVKKKKTMETKIATNRIPKRYPPHPDKSDFVTLPINPRMAKITIVPIRVISTVSIPN